MSANSVSYGCGLPNVRLLGYSFGSEPRSVRVERINVLHHVIAKAVADQPGPLTPSEIRFLRTELGYTQEVLSDWMDISIKELRLAESGLQRLTRLHDVALRRLMYARLDLEPPHYEESCRVYDSVRDPNPVISVRAGDTEHFWQLV